MDKLISIITVNYNGRKWLPDFFETLGSQSYRNFEIIIVDNASTDGSCEFIKKNFSKITITQNRENVGFGKANNLGVKKAQGEIIFFLNNDTLLEKDTLKKLLTFKTNNNLNILGPKILDYEGKDVHEGKKCSIDYTGYIGYAEKTFFIDGCALMISKKNFLYLGGFDEKYFMYSEEIDLCWRAHLYGMKVGVCNKAKIKHAGGGTGGSTLFHERGKHEVPLQRRYEVEKNNLRNLLKNYSFINLLWVIPFFIMQSLVESLLYFLTGNISACLAIWRAHLWNVINFTNTLERRKIVQSQRSVKDETILSMMSGGPNKLRALFTIGIPKFVRSPKN